MRITNGASATMLNGNFIGTTASGDAALGNADNGVWIDHANRNFLIGCQFVNNPFVYYNVVSGNGQEDWAPHHQLRQRGRARRFRRRRQQHHARR